MLHALVTCALYVTFVMYVTRVTGSYLYLKEELAELQKELEQMEVAGGESEEDKERNSQIETQYNTDKSKMHKMRLAIVCLYCIYDLPLYYTTTIFVLIIESL